MRKTTLVLPFVLLILVAAVSAQPPAKPRLIAGEIPVSVLTSSPTDFDQAMVEVRGRLIFAGRDYFTDPVFVIEDSDGNEVEVSAWAPLEIPPLPPDLPRPAQIPQTMRDYLGKSFLVHGLFSAEDHSIAVRAAAEVEGTEANRAKPAAASPIIRALPMGPPQSIYGPITPQPQQPRGRLAPQPVQVMRAEP